MLQLKKILLSKSAARGIIANYGTSVSVILLSFLFTPVYIHYLGIEAFGIIAFINSLMVFINFLDLGMGASINREMAKHYHDPAQAEYVYKLNYSLQFIYLGIGLLILLLLTGLAPLLATQWFNAKHTSTGTVQYAFIILSITIACRWPYSFYSSALRGMHLQVLLNLHEIGWNIVRYVGCWILLRYFNASLISYLWFQCLAIALQTAGSFLITWYFIPPARPAKAFDFAVIKSIARFAGTMSLGSVLVAFIFETDKLVLSKTLPGPEYGYYMFAVGLAVLVYNISMPIGMAVFPHFTSYVHGQEWQKLKQDFHKYTRLLSVLLLPFVAVLFTYAPEILLLWTKNPQLVSNASLLLRIMLLGTVLHAFMAVPHVLLLAMAKTKFIIRSHFIALVLIVPLSIWLSLDYGAKGGAIGYAIIFGGYFIVQAPLIIRKCLPGSEIRWFWNDIFRIALPVCLLAAVVYRFLPASFCSGRGGFIIFPLLFIVLFLLAYFLSGLNLHGPLLKKLRSNKDSKAAKTAAES